MSEDVKDNQESDIVEKRIKPTVIRRRARVVKPVVEKVEAKEEEAALAESREKEPVLTGKQLATERKLQEQAKDIGKEERKIHPSVDKVVRKPEVSVPKLDLEPARSRETQERPHKHNKLTIEINEEKKPAKKRALQPPKRRDSVSQQALLSTGEKVFEPRVRKKKKVKKTGVKKTEITMPKAIKRIIKISEYITVLELSKKMGVKSSEVIKKLIGMGMMATINQSLDLDTATLIASEFNYEVENILLEFDQILEEEEVKEEDMEPRPPVVTIMGHVDHGKTTLLDAIRKTDVTAGESGGITQHIGAYDVKLDNGDIVFLDTPGHEAFTAMRARGAKVTDIVVLVVAADDGVMPQTVEAIDHAKAADVPIIVAVNKIDKPDADPDRIKQELTKYELIPEEWGGNVMFVSVSAIKGTGLKDLLEVILLQSEVLELKAAAKTAARGTIIESRLDKGRGAVATVLVQSGTLKIGDCFVTGIQSGKVRGLQNDHGKKVKEAGPSIPVEVIGLSGAPDAGDDFIVVPEERIAKQISLHRQEKSRDIELARSGKVTLEQLYDRIQIGEIHDLKIVIKADVQGSIEAISESLQKLSTDKVKLSVIHTGVGGISESDVLLASASDAIIIGFHVRPGTKASALAEMEHIDIRTYSIIYDVVNDIRAAMEGLLSPVVKEVYLGRAEIRETYTISRVGTIAGCHVIDGKMTRNAGVRILRDNVVVFEGSLASLKRFKDDVKEVQTGYECGLSVENFNDIKVGNVVEAFTHESEAAKL